MASFGPPFKWLPNEMPLLKLLNERLLNETFNHIEGWYPLLDMFASISYQSHLIVGLIMSVILVMAVVGNLTIIGVFLGCARLRTPSNMLIVNLAVADLLMALTGFPLLITNSIQGTWVYSFEVCQFYGFTGTMFGLMGINTMVFISIDRLIMTNTLQDPVQISFKHVAFCIAAAWAYSAAWATFPLLGWNRYILQGYGSICGIDCFTRESPDRYFLPALLIADYIFPVSIITWCYTNIFQGVRQHLADVKRCIALGKLKPEPKWSPTEYKIARTCLLVMIMYCLTWTPFAIVLLVGQYGDIYNITPTNSMLPALLAKLSTIYNPIIYALSHPQFKDAYHSILIQLNIIRNRNRLGNHPGNTDFNSSHTMDNEQSNEDCYEEDDYGEQIEMVARG